MERAHIAVLKGGEGKKKRGKPTGDNECSGLAAQLRRSESLAGIRIRAALQKRKNILCSALGPAQTLRQDGANELYKFVPPCDGLGKELLVEVAERQTGCLEEDTKADVGGFDGGDGESVLGAAYSVEVGIKGYRCHDVKC